MDLELRKLKLRPTNADPCVYISPDRTIIVAIYVDDLIIISNNKEEIIKLKSKLSKEFEMKDLGNIHHCLGIEFKQDMEDNTITMKQSKYIKQILEHFGMQECKAVATPMETNQKLNKPKNVDAHLMKRLPYQSLIGSLLYLSTSTRPDIAYATSVLSQFNNCYDETHWIAGKRILRYLKGTLNHGLIFKRSDQPLTGYVDADYAGCPIDRKSYTGYAFILAKCAVTWKAKKQSTTATSSTEAEYMALTEGAKEAIYLKRFATELGVDIKRVVLYNDNQGAQKLARNPVFHDRTKHIDVRYHYTREVIEAGTVDTAYQPTENMTADVLTKSLNAPRHQRFTGELGLGTIYDGFGEAPDVTLSGGVKTSKASSA